VQDNILETMNGKGELPGINKRTMMALNGRLTIDLPEWRWVFVFSAALLLIVSLPFIWAYAVALPDSTFMGVVVNPIDGATYQAKMMQGFRGSWLFRLVYTPEDHQGVFLFTFYLLMGHLSRILNIPPIMTFTIFRLIGGFFMFTALYRFVADWTEDTTQRRITWSIMVLGSGFGWLAAAFGYVSSDLLVLPEAFPLQAVYANPHFPLSIAAAAMIAHIFYVVFFVERDLRPGFTWDTAILAFSTLFLVSASPFVLLPLSAACIVVVMFLWRTTGRFPQREFEWGLVCAVVGLPLIAYNLWAVSSANPIFNAWMQQNQTASPPVWDYLIAFGPMLTLAGIGLYATYRRHFELSDLFLLTWLVTNILLLYAPLGLQRRFALGLILPVGLLAGRGLRWVLMTAVKRRWRPLMVMLVFLIITPTTLVAVVLPMVGATLPASEDAYFVSNEKIDAFEWLENETRSDSVVLAAPSTSLYVPIYGRRIVYAHPFETLNAAKREKAVVDFFTGQSCDVIDDESVDYVLVSPTERRLTGDAQACPIPGIVVYSSPSGSVEIYETSGS